MSYQIFSDVTADMNEAMLSRFPALHMIPMNVNLGNTDYLYGPGGNLEIKEFYERQRNGEFASSSQISPYTYRQMFEPVLQAGEDVLYLCFTSGLSGTIETARSIAADLRDEFPDRRIEVLDTLCAAVGEGFLVYEAMKQYESGLNMDELCAWVEERKLKVCHWFTVDTFDHLRHGGRVSAASATMGTLLNIKPLLHVDLEGKLEVSGKPRGRKQATKMQIDKMKQGWQPELGRFILIGHGDCQDVADHLKNDILAIYPEAEIETAYIGPVIGAHTGPGMLALIFWGSVR